MHKIEIKKNGPIEQLEMNINKFNILIGVSDGTCCRLSAA